MNNVVVIDANIAIKMLHREEDTEQARALFKSCTKNGTKILVPEHFLYEIMNVCQHPRVNVPASEVLEFYDALKASILTVVTPSRETWLKAEIIVRNGNDAGGFPSIYDSIYHAIALEVGAFFVTADKRHVAKTVHHGNVMRLDQWILSDGHKS